MEDSGKFEKVKLNKDNRVKFLYQWQTVPEDGQCHRCKGSDICGRAGLRKQDTPCDADGCNAKPRLFFYINLNDISYLLLRFTMFLVAVGLLAFVGLWVYATINNVNLAELLNQALFP